tara:strand:- start:5275 stop:5772 length:498 start_codon:yes stop_codon:yes gene_type:complete
MQEINWSEKIKDALDRTEFMALSTQGENGSWVCPVAFSYDESVNLYFISLMDSVHVKNLLKNDSVSVAIYRTERFGDGDVIGLQAVGNVKHVTESEELSVCSGYYFGRNEDNDSFRDSISAEKGEGAGWQFFKITLDQMWYFNSFEYGEKRMKVPLETLAIAAPN